jgi:N-glycosylase/DNA lyase
MRLEPGAADAALTTTRAPAPASGGRCGRCSDNRVLTLAWPIDLALTIAGHGWVHLEPWRWDADAGVLSRAERIGRRTGTIALSQAGATSLAVAWSGFAAADDAEALRRAARWVSADWDPGAAIAAIRPHGAAEAALIEAGGGRLLRGSTFYEDFVKTVLTINTTWASTCRMSAALVAEPGDGVFPVPGMILDYGEARLRTTAKLGFRAPTLIAATQRLLADGAIDADGKAADGRIDHDYLIGLKGIGPYAAAHCGMLLHDFSRIPIDTVVTAFVREQFGHEPAEFIAARAECGAYLALLYRLMRLRHRLDGKAAEG